MQTKFEEWFYDRQGGGFALRAEYFYEDCLMDQDDEQRKMSVLKSWLEEAFEAGKASNG